MNRAVFSVYKDSSKKEVVKTWGMGPCATESDAWAFLKSISGKNYKANRALMSVVVKPIERA